MFRAAIVHLLIAASVIAGCESAAVTTGPGEPAGPFCTQGFEITLPHERITLERGRTFGELDQYGVPHPVRHATVAGWLLDDGDIAGAATLANELLDIAEMDEGALYFPYLFPWPSQREGFPDLEPPWYSGMAQGKALGLFARLYEVTGDTRWKESADATYQSFVRQDDERRVWHLDGDHYWIDTFSWPEPDPILNGMLYAIVGLLDYWRVTGSGEKVLREAVETIGLEGHRFMLPGGHHSYDLDGNGPAGGYYQRIVYEQMQKLGTMAPCLRKAAATFFDPPEPSLSPAESLSL